VQLYRYFVSQSSEFCRHNPLCCFSMSVCCCLFRYQLSPETFGYTLIAYIKVLFQHLSGVTEDSYNTTHKYSYFSGQDSHPKLTEYKLKC